MINETIKVGGWTGWGSGAKRNGGDPPHCTATIHLATVLFTMYLQFMNKISVSKIYRIFKN
jgi:hypothetical protein